MGVEDVENRQDVKNVHHSERKVVQGVAVIAKVLKDLSLIRLYAVEGKRVGKTYTKENHNHNYCISCILDLSVILSC